MKITTAHYWALYHGQKLPRKIKKALIGKKMSSTKLRVLLDSVTLGEPIKTMYERREIYPFAFCPKCGCEGYRGSGNLTDYPEHWESFYCLRCKNLVGNIDNSPFIHALECKENNYDPRF